MNRRIVPTAILLGLVTSGPALGQSPTPQEVLAALKKESGEYLNSIRHYQLEIKWVAVYQGTGQEVRREIDRYRQNGVCNLLASTDAHTLVAVDKLGRAEDRAFCVNTRYAFELNRPPGKDWVVVKFHDLSTGPPPNLFRPPGIQDPVLKHMSPYWVNRAFFLPDLVDLPEFKVTRVEPPVGSLVRVGYVYEEKVYGTTNTGTVTFDTARRWVVTGYENAMTRKGFTIFRTRTQTFTTTPDGLPVLSEVREVEWNDDPEQKGVKREDVYTYTYTREQADQMDFTLTAFGLPEPPGLVWEKPRPRYVWILLAAVAFGVLALGFRYVARRRSARSQAS